ncbi:MAG: FkbM family methyltransferase [Verrucomicrobiales bacterium]|nr:FkbM family methyltransferase [Verrucomicrobiales bacterium]
MVEYLKQEYQLKKENLDHADSIAAKYRKPLNVKVKTALLRLMGEDLLAYIQGVRFYFLLKKGIDFEPELKILPNLINEGDVVVDVGANGANWTFAMDQVVGKEGKVYAFEADPYYAKATKIASKLLGCASATVFPFGLSNVPGEFCLRIFDGRGERLSGTGSINRDMEGNASDYQKVELKTLDSMVSDFPDLGSVSLIKCDVEGFELFVFQGASQLLDEARPIVIFEVGRFSEQGYTNEDIFSFFHEKEYKAFVSVPGEMISQVPDSLECDDAIGANRIMVPSEKVDQLANLVREG